MVPSDLKRTSWSSRVEIGAGTSFTTLSVVGGGMTLGGESVVVVLVGVGWEGGLGVVPVVPEVSMDERSGS